MPTTRTTLAREASEFTQIIREALLTTIQQGQQMAIAATRAWAQAVPPEMLKAPSLPTIPDIRTVNRLTFYALADVFKAQREFAEQLANVFVPEPAA